MEHRNLTAPVGEERKEEGPPSEPMLTSLLEGTPEKGTVS
jgi:hypothetical protein